ncbi:MAG: HAMP domain-containing sensor histidine kinase [Candidatus Gastranaerophilales bacterium]|nr:HAMP domain-containing sensor histidine kinase [Candidatus Gastranaerophilales bacterium]
MDILFLVLIVVLLLLLFFVVLYRMEHKKRITLTKFLNRISITAQEVRYGNLSRRLRSSLTTDTKLIAENINRMIEALTDRELMIKAYQMELEEQKHDLEELVKIQQDFTATLTHDLKVPILAEINALKLFSKESFGSITSQQKDVIKSMIKNNEELLFLVNTLLDTCKNRSGALKISKNTESLAETINESIEEVSFLVKKHAINFVPPKKPLMLDFDKIEIKRVIKNLLNNAISHTKEDGVICVEIVLRKKEVEVIVIDNGRGIAVSDLDKVFEKYFSTAKKMRKVGTGLGLFLSKQIIEKHGGRIWAESEEGKGSRFHFTLPF